MHKIPAHTNQHFCIYVVLCDMWAQAHIQKIANTCVKISRTLTLMPGLVEIWIVYDANLEMLRFKLIQGLAVLPVTRSNPSSKKSQKNQIGFPDFPCSSPTYLFSWTHTNKIMKFYFEYI